VRGIVGFGAGRAHAGFAFTVKDSKTGKVLWKKTIKETASFWSNSASSSAQRSELPEKVAKSFVEELQKAKLVPSQFLEEEKHRDTEAQRHREGRN